MTKGGSLPTCLKYRLALPVLKTGYSASSLVVSTSGSLRVALAVAGSGIVPSSFKFAMVLPESEELWRC